MKKSLLIIGGVLIIVVLVALWMYLLFFGTPKNVDDVFSSFSFGDDEAPVVTELPAEPPPVVTETPLVNVSGEPLRQLTTKPVIGYREVQATASATPSVYYAEAGTGHIFSINLQTGEETRLSGTTVGEAVRADFSDNGRYVVMQSGYGQALTTSIGELTSETSVEFSTRPDQIADFVITPNNELLYTVRGAVTTGKALSLATRATRTLFTLPFREAVISWGATATSTHYIYPKPSYLLQGFVYAAEGGKLSRLPLSGFGLTADGGKGIIIGTQIEGDTPVSYIYNTKTNIRFAVSLLILPEKCVVSTKAPGRFWCASYTGDTSRGFPDTWYRGEVASRDALYEVEATESSIASTNLVNTFTATSREVDATGMTIGRSEDRLYFMNRNDNTLWLYDVSL